MRLIHITDPHLTSLEGISPAHFTGKRRLGYLSWRRRRRWHLRSHLDELCAAAQALQPDLMLVTGDLVHLGLAAEAEAAAEWLSALGPPERVLAVPGNHDLYRGDAWAAVQAHWAGYLHLGAPAADAAPDAAPDAAGREAPHWARFPSHLRRDGIELHGLNSGLPTPIFTAAGELGAAQRDRLAKQLATASADALHILALHHPPAPGAIGRRKALRDARALAPLAGRVPLALHGHVHRDQSYRLGQARVFATNSASLADASFRRFDIEREGGGWRIEMRLERRAPGGFATAAAETFAVPGGLA